MTVTESTNVKRRGLDPVLGTLGFQPLPCTQHTPLPHQFCGEAIPAIQGVVCGHPTPLCYHPPQGEAEGRGEGEVRLSFDEFFL